MMTQLTKKNQFVRICTDKIAQSTYRFFLTNFVYLSVLPRFVIFRGKLPESRLSWRMASFRFFIVLKPGKC